MTQAFYPVGFRATDSDDNPLAGGYLLYFAAQTTTPKAVYADAAATQSLGTRVDLNSSGMPVDGANTPTMIYPGAGAYKARLYAADDTLIVEQDDLPGKEEDAAEVTTALPTTPVISKSSAYTVTVNERGKLINANPTGGSFAITLPSAVTLGDNFRVGVRHNGSANQVSVISSGSQFVRAHKALRSYALTGMGETAWFVSDGSDWIVDGYHPPFWKATAPYFRVLDRLTAPPTNPDAGARYIINGTPTGAWNTLGLAENDIAEADGNGSWIRLTPETGWMAFDADEEQTLQFKNNTWENFQVDPGTSTLKTLIVQDQRASGTNGGSVTTGAWTTAVLNTSVVNTIDDSSLASNTITLPAGTYDVEACKTFLMTKRTRIRFKTKDDDSIVIHAPGVYVGDHDSNSDQRTEAGSPIWLKGRFTIAVSTDFVLQYHAEENPTTGSFNGAGLGRAHGLTPEVYSTVVITDLASLQGPKGDQGDPGPDGLDAAYSYQWNTATSGDPGVGKILADNATPASITQINISQTDAVTADLTNVIASWDNSTSIVKARLRITKEGATQNFLEFLITGAGTDAGDYWTFPVSYVSHGGTLSNNDELAVLVVDKGDKGDAGASGPTGCTNFNFDNATTDSDPGTGNLRLNHATPASATEIYIDNLNTSSVDVTGWLDTFDDAGETGMRGYIVVMDALSASSVFRIYALTGSVVDGTGYRKLSVTHLAGGGSFTNGNEVLVSFFPRGPAGSGLADVVDDTSPQLGGDLDLNGQNITGTGDISIAGTVSESGVTISPIGKQTLYIPAAAWNPTITNGAGRTYEELATNDLIRETLDFDTTTQEFATYAMPLPKKWNAGSVTFRVHWCASSGTPADTVDWALAAVAISNDDASDAAPGTPVVVSDALIATTDHHITAESGAVTIGGTPAKGDFIVFKLQRDVSTDNLAADAKMIGVEIHWTPDAATDA